MVPTEVRTTHSLTKNWRFIQDDKPSDDTALQSSGSDWQTRRNPLFINTILLGGTVTEKLSARGRP